MRAALERSEPWQRHLLAVISSWGMPVPAGSLCSTADDGLWGAGYTSSEELREALMDVELLYWDDRTGFIYMLPPHVYLLHKHLSEDMRREGVQRARDVIAHLDRHERYPYRPHLNAVDHERHKLGLTEPWGE